MTLTLDTGEQAIYFWEALVTGEEKGDDHGEDAGIAVEAFIDDQKLKPEPDEDVISILGLALHKSGWSLTRRFSENLSKSIHQMLIRFDEITEKLNNFTFEAKLVINPFCFKGGAFNAFERFNR